MLPIFCVIGTTGSLLDRVSSVIPCLPYAPEIMLCLTRHHYESLLSISRLIAKILENLIKTCCVEYPPLSIIVKSPHPSSMANFPEVTSRDYTLRQTPNGLVQELVSTLHFPFQHSANFDYYQPCKFDFIFLDAPINNYAVLHNNLAHCIWESVKMKGCYILASAHGWDGDTAATPLPTSIPDVKLKEIHMLPPPLMPNQLLAFNKLLFPERPTIIRALISALQEQSRMLSAWICQAKINSSRIRNCSWTWPADPISYFPNDALLSDTDSDDLSSTTTECDSVFDEKPTLIPAAQVSHALANLETFKRSHSSSPLDLRRDGNDPSKKQLVLWQPTVQQLLEQQHALMTGEVASYSRPLSLIVPRLPWLPPIPHPCSIRVSSSRLPIPFTLTHLHPSRSSSSTISTPRIWLGHLSRWLLWEYSENIGGMMYGGWYSCSLNPL